MPQLIVQTCIGSAIQPYLDDLARLRIAVFRDFPYLYDGDMDYERHYLQTYSNCPQSLFVLVFDPSGNNRVVGASTGMPMAAEDAAFQLPFRQRGFDISSIFYFGESVLLPAYRGHGLGHRFFDEREAFARTQPHLQWTAFCAVHRPGAHPLRPRDYRPLDSFWRKRGYTRCDELHASFTWKDIDQPSETAKTLTFWRKGWPPRA